VGQVVPSATGGFVPSIDTREIITQVLVNDGQTVVLGGILETEIRDTVNKVPYLGDIRASACCSAASRRPTTRTSC